MAKPNNKDKDPKIDESVLDETPPNINEPQDKSQDDDPENQDPNPDPVIEAEKKEDPEIEEPVKEAEVLPEEDKKDEVEPQGESQEQKEQRYKAQQTEAQIQAARNRALTDKVEEADKLPEPTIEELKAYVAQEGVNWDELTVFEQSMTKKTYISEKRFSIVNQAVQNTKKINEWASQVDTFIDSTDGKPEFVPLSGHEADFRSYCMKEGHRGAPLDVLLGSFLHNLPAKAPKRGSIFLKGGGGEKDTSQGKITDADEVANLRVTNPREYKRQLQSGKIALEV